MGQTYASTLTVAAQTPIGGAGDNGDDDNDVEMKMTTNIVTTARTCATVTMQVLTPTTDDTRPLHN